MNSNPARSVVLVVEDDVDVRESLADSIRDEGYEVATAANGLEALEWLQDNPAPCLILLDLWMPVMSGEDFRAAQLQDPSLASIPVIIISAATDAAKRASLLGARRCLTKPILFETLLRTLEEHC